MEARRAGRRRRKGWAAAGPQRPRRSVRRWMTRIGWSGPARPAWLKAAAARFGCRPGRGHIVAAARLQLVKHIFIWTSDRMFTNPVKHKSLKFEYVSTIKYIPSRTSTHTYKSQHIHARYNTTQWYVKSAIAKHFTVYIRVTYRYGQHSPILANKELRTSILH